MRNGNIPIYIVKLSTLEFLPYLWGMETLELWKATRLWALFLPYLWGMETEQALESVLGQIQFLPYLWGMETTGKWHDWRNERKFLPYLWGMETEFLCQFLCRTPSSYRTYEEWKLQFLKQFHKFNQSSYRTYEEWKHKKITTIIVVSCVLTVPMRNGNFILLLFILLLFSSYRTYEEWKPGKVCRWMGWEKRSYRTYEEWKHLGNPLGVKLPD